MVPFTVNYTKEDSVKFRKELKESGSVMNPKFYEDWDLVEVGTPEYYERLEVKREDFSKLGYGTKEYYKKLNTGF
jgi:hypothetical protein